VKHTSTVAPNLISLISFNTLIGITVLMFSPERLPTKPNSFVFFVVVFYTSSKYCSALLNQSSAKLL